MAAQVIGDASPRAAADSGRALLWVSIAAMALGAALVAAFAQPGPVSVRMLQHLAVMNVAAPLIATFLPSRSPDNGPAELWAAGSLQMILLWAWHAPVMQTLFAQSPVMEFGASLLLLICAIWFWREILIAVAEGQWRAVGALLLTGKLACLLGAVLVFSPRDLYAGISFAWCGTGMSTLPDQQLAGLLMITACPLSYLIAGTTIAGRLLLALDDADPDVRSNR